MRELKKIFSTHDPRQLAMLAAAWIILSYIFVSLAIDSGRLTEWLIGLFFAGWGISEIVRAFYYGFKK